NPVPQGSLQNTFTNAPLPTHPPSDQLPSFASHCMTPTALQTTHIFALRRPTPQWFNYMAAPPNLTPNSAATFDSEIANPSIPLDAPSSEPPITYLWHGFQSMRSSFEERLVCEAAKQRKHSVIIFPSLPRLSTSKALFWEDGHAQSSDSSWLLGVYRYYIGLLSNLYAHISTATVEARRVRVRIYNTWHTYMGNSVGRKNMGRVPAL
ncbi:hypothetical protein V5O48_016694, partial [Marasmius crinis-equi]